MNTTETGPKIPVAPGTGEKVDLFGSFADLFTKGVERMAGLQKQGLDLAIQQNTDVVGVWKKHIHGSTGASAPLMFDQFGTLLEKFVETQKSAIDMVVEQSRTLASTVKERNVKAVKAGKEGVTLAQDAIDQSVAAQKTVLEYSAQQTKAVFDTAKKQLGYAGTPAEAAADTVQRGVEIAIEAQKDMLDAIKAPMQILH